MNTPLAQARALLLRYGWNATVYQILNPGFRLWFARDRQAVIGYVRSHRYRVVAGAPVCDEAQLADVVREWEQAARRCGECVCYFGAAGRLMTLLGTHPGYSRVALGAQPVWHPAQWCEATASHSSLRAQLNRARNKGVEVSEWPVERAHRHPDLQRCLREWLRTRGLPSLHFLVEPQTLACLGDRRIWVAHRNERVVGFVVLAPIPCRNGWLTEQFVRGREAPNGTIELLLDTAISTLNEEGVTYLTMGLVPLAQCSDAEENPLWLRLLLRWVRAHGRRFYNFDGLEAFKAKFLPRAWEPIYAITNETRFSLHSLYAIAAAFSGCSPLLAVTRGMGRAALQEMRWLRAAARSKRKVRK